MNRRDRRVGSQSLIVRDYVHDFGLCVLNLTYAENNLRDHLVRLAEARAKWPLRKSELAAIEAKYGRFTLGQSVPELKKLGGDPKLVIGLEALVPQRNNLRHSVLDLIDVATGQVPKATIEKHRRLLDKLSNDARRCSHGVQKADVALFKQMIAKAVETGPTTQAEREAMATALSKLESIADRVS